MVEFDDDSELRRGKLTLWWLRSRKSAGWQQSSVASPKRSIFFHQIVQPVSITVSICDFGKDRARSARFTAVLHGIELFLQRWKLTKIDKSKCGIFCGVFSECVIFWERIQSIEDRIKYKNPNSEKLQTAAITTYHSLDRFTVSIYCSRTWKASMYSLNHISKILVKYLAHFRC